MSTPGYKRFLSSSFLFFLCFVSAATAADIQWKLFLNRHMDAPLLEKTTREGEELVVREADCRQIPSESGDIVNAMDGISFKLDQSPVSGSLAIHIILNVNGNVFEPVGGTSLFLNMTFAAYVNGILNDYLDLGSSPLVMTIPQTGLSYFLSACSLSHTNLVCVYNSGGVFTDDGIETEDVTTRMIVSMDALTNTVGGIGEDLGIESKVKYDTWSKIKLLFR